MFVMLFFITFLLETTITSPSSFWIPWGQLWYIPVWVLCSLIAIMIIKTQNERKIKYLVIGVSIILVGIVYNTNGNHGLNFSREFSIGPFPLGLIRGMQDVMLGMILGIVTEGVIVWRNKVQITKLGIIFVTLLEIGCILCLGIIYFMQNVTPEVDYIYIIFSSMLIMLSELNIDLLNQIVDKISKGPLAKVIRLNSAIYFFHYPVVLFMRAKDMVNISLRNIVLYLFIVVIVAWLGFKCEFYLRKACESLWHKMYYV